MLECQFDEYAEYFLQQAKEKDQIKKNTLPKEIRMKESEKAKNAFKMMKEIKDARAQIPKEEDHLQILQDEMKRKEKHTTVNKLT